MKHVVGIGGASLVFFLSSVAAAQDAPQSPEKAREPLPTLFMTTGGGWAGPPIPSMYKAQGYSLGELLYGSVHVFPFRVRELGFVARGDVTMLDSPDGKSPTIAAPWIFSVVGGPEAQTRAGAFMFRGALLGGARFYNAGVATIAEPRVLVHTQVEYALGGGSSATVFGFVAGLDLVPAVGWSAGATMSFAIF